MGRTLKSPSRSGLTIGETLVSLSILSILMVALLNLFPSAMAVLHQTRAGWLAGSTAQDRIESLAAQPFASLAVGYSDVNSVKLSDGTTARLETTITSVDGHPEKLLKRLRCEVRWDGRSNERSAVQEIYVHSVRR